MADTKISDLSAAATIDGSELLLLSQGGADKKVDLNTLREQLDWVRPSDWPAMPATAANTIHLLVAVFPNDTIAQVRVNVSSGTFSVDWGDGTSNTGVTDDTNVSHLYDFADGDLPAATSRGYKVAVITITTSGGNIVDFRLNEAVGGYGNGIHPWLEWQINAASATQVFISNNTSRLLEHVNIVDIGNLSTLASLFSTCARLKKIQFPSNMMSAATVATSMFSGCHKLARMVDLSTLNTGLLTASSMFASMYSLKDVEIPSGKFASVTAADSLFASCGLLEEVTFPSGALAAVTNANSMFNGCNSLRKVTFPSGAFAVTTSATLMFGSCGVLTEIEFPTGAFAAITNIGTMFFSCSALQHIKFPTGAFGSVTTATNVFQNCANLTRIENCSIPISFSIAGARIQAPELDEIYTALPTITSQTITVTSNPGTSGDDPTIATAKGWTVTG